ncbi:MAG TPA: DUF1064 domain-containing protein [Negativicutes bacterium]|nr:DUF1064 domain-containing protein [Negativicutes bacterium]
MTKQVTKKAKYRNNKAVYFKHTGQVCKVEDLVKGLDKQDAKEKVHQITDRTGEGILFDSMLEAEYYRDIIVPKLETGTITKCILHPRYLLQKKFEKYGRIHKEVYYEADFELNFDNGPILVIDIKGMATETALLKRKLFDSTYPDMTLNWISHCQKYGGWIAYDDLLAMRRKNKKQKAA